MTRKQRERSFPKGYNPNRNEYLYWYTREGYIIAQDILCQYEFVDRAQCPECGGKLRVVAHLNRDGQGLSEMVSLCTACGHNVNVIFDISNEIYQEWLAEQLGPMYVPPFEEEPRTPYSPD
ncbi:MAG: hypothetical protein GYB66_16555 [Chloroflexi bacterium]|nr:hypothetical protein [Chloroflexota bacterium]